MPKASGVAAAAARRSAPTYADLAARTRALQPRLRRKRLTVATAESCTGGLLGTLLTEHGGASAVYLGGAVVYADAAKESLAGVPPQLLHAHGAVSAVVAGALARGIRARLGAKVGLGITGVAGPGGATPGKPVGLVFVAVDSDRLSAVRKCSWPHDRAGNRLASAGAALDLLERVLA